MLIHHRRLKKVIPCSTVQACHLDIDKQRIGASLYYLCNRDCNYVSFVEHSLLSTDVHSDASYLLNSRTFRISYETSWTLPIFSTWDSRTYIVVGVRLRIERTSTPNCVKSLAIETVLDKLVRKPKPQPRSHVPNIGSCINWLKNNQNLWCYYFLLPNWICPQH